MIRTLLTISILFYVLNSCKSTNSTRTDFQSGIDCFLTEKLDSAKFFFRKSIDNGESLGKSYFYLGRIFYTQGFYFDYVDHELIDSAIHNYWLAEKFGYSNDSLNDGLIKCYRWIDNLELKEKGYNKLINLNPDHLTTWYFRAETRKELGKFQLALDDYEQLISLDSEMQFDYHVKYFAGLMCHILGDSTKSKQYFDESLELSKKTILRPYNDWDKNVKTWMKNTASR